MTIKIQTETKKGTKIELKLDEYRNMKLSVEGLFQNRSFQVAETKGQRILHAGTVEKNGEKFAAAVPVNEDIEKFLEEARREKKEYEEAQTRVNIPGESYIWVDSRNSVEEILENHSGYIQKLQKKGWNAKSHIEKAVRSKLNRQEQEQKRKENIQKQSKEKFETAKRKAKETGQKQLWKREQMEIDGRLSYIEHYVLPEGKVEKKSGYRGGKNG